MQLNLPSFDFKVEHREGKPYIFDVVRKKYVKLDPEEWVRQHFIHYLLQKGYPRSLMKIEGGHQFNRLQKRSDILVYNRQGQPFLLVECKAPAVKISNKTFWQAGIYNQTCHAPYLVVTNGLSHYFCKVDFVQKTCSFLPDLPAFGAL